MGKHKKQLGRLRLLGSLLTSICFFWPLWVAADTQLDRQNFESRYLDEPYPFFENQLVTGEAIRGPETKEIPISQLFHKDSVEQLNLPTMGTFLIELPQLGDRQWGIKIPEIPTYNLYINQQLVKSKGNIGEESSAERGSEIVVLPQSDQPITLALQVSSEHYGWFMPLGKLELAPAKDLLEEQRRKDLLIAFVIGAIVISGIYQFSIFALNRREKSYIIFGFFCSLMAARLALGSDTAMLSRFFPNFSYEWSWKIGFMAYYVSIPLFVCFIYREFPRLVPAIHIKITSIIGLISTIIVLFTNNSFYGTYNWIYHFNFIYASLVSCYAIGKSFRNGLVGSRTMVLGVTTMTACTANDIMIIQDMYKGPELVFFGLLVFISCQSLILALKFSHAFKTLRHTKRELSKIVYPHMIEQIVAGEKLESTMPVGFQHAIIISFDIVGSTKIQHKNFALTLENVMARLQGELNTGYNGARFQSNGYRLKEMGDGLLVSIGFPFHQPTDQNLAEHAVLMAEKMCAIFKEEMERLRLKQPSFCGVGIVEGMVEGFFRLQELNNMIFAVGQSTLPSVMRT